MGNYPNVSNNPPLNFDFKKHEFETQCLQRIKQTPFIDAEPYSLNPPIFIDRVGIRLQELIHPRMSTQQFFPPQEIIKIMKCILLALVQLQKMNYRAHGDVDAKTIFYDSKTKKFKLMHPLFSPQSGFDLSLGGKRFSFLSPEQLVLLTEQESLENQTTTKISFKSDIFTFGILMCQVCSLLPSSDIYCPETYKIFDLEIQSRLSLIDKFYGGNVETRNDYIKIRKSIQSMLQYQQVARKSAKQILQILDAYNIQQKQAHQMEHLGRENPSNFQRLASPDPNTRFYGNH